MACERCGRPLHSGEVCVPCGTRDLPERLRFRRNLLLVLAAWRREDRIAVAPFVALSQAVNREIQALVALEKGLGQPPPEPSKMASDVESKPVPSIVETLAGPRPPLTLERPPISADEQRLVEELRGEAAIEPLVRHFPLPPVPDTERGQQSLEVVGRFLRERTGWVAGVVLTVVGSFYVAGTVWGQLTAGWRQALVLLFLALYAVGFSALGHRLGRVKGAEAARKWLLGVSAALVPVHAMAVGGLWAVEGTLGWVAVLGALGAVGLLHYRLLSRSLPAFLPPRSAPFLATYLALSLSVALVPRVWGPGWIFFPGLLALVGVWAALTRWRQIPASAIGLLAYTIVFHGYLVPPGPIGAYAPVTALGALGVLYLDAALGRWRGIHGMRLRGPRGVVALALAALALLFLVPGLRPLPTGPESAVTGLLLAAFFMGAALAWRRPVLILAVHLSTLIFVLALPDLFRAIVDPFREAARLALGYRHEPLPLAWYCLTLLPYLLFNRFFEEWTLRGRWRQAPDLALHTFRWTLGLSALLAIVSHSRPDDLRPALLALPIYAVFWLREPRVRRLLGGAIPWVFFLVWPADLMLWLGWPSEIRLVLAGLMILVLCPFSAFLARRRGDDGLETGALTVAVAGAAILPLAVGGAIQAIAQVPSAEAWPLLAPTVTVMGLAMAGIGLEVRPRQALPVPPLEERLILAGTLLALIGGLSTLNQHLPHEALVKALLFQGSAFVLVLGAWAYRRLYAGGRSTWFGLQGMAHIMALTSLVPVFRLDDPERALLRLSMGILVVHWMHLAVKSRPRAEEEVLEPAQAFGGAFTVAQVYGAVLVAGLVEGVVRRLAIHLHWDLASLVVAGTLAAFVPGGLLALWRSLRPSGSRHYVHESVGYPSVVIATLGVAPAAWLLVQGGLDLPEQRWMALALVGALGLASILSRGGASVPGLARWSLSQVYEGLAWVSAASFAVSFVQAEPAWWGHLPLVLVTLALGLLSWKRPDPIRGALAVAAIAAALAMGILGGPLHGLDLLAAAGVGCSFQALLSKGRWADAALTGWGVLAILALERFLSPGPSWLLLAVSAISGVLYLASRRDDWTVLGPAATRVGQVISVVGALGWALDLGLLGAEQRLGFWPVALAAQVGILFLWRMWLAPWVMVPFLAATVLAALQAPLWVHPIVNLALASAYFVVIGRGGRDRVYVRSILGITVLELLAISMQEPGFLPMLAPVWLGVGVLAVASGLPGLVGWVGLFAGILSAVLYKQDMDGLGFLAPLSWTLFFAALLARGAATPLKERTTLVLVTGLVCGGAVLAATQPHGWLVASLVVVATGLLDWLRHRGAVEGPGPVTALILETGLLLAAIAVLAAFPMHPIPQVWILAPCALFLAWIGRRQWHFTASIPVFAALITLPFEGGDVVLAWSLALVAMGMGLGFVRFMLPGRTLGPLFGLGFATALAPLLLADNRPGSFALVAFAVAVAWWSQGVRAMGLIMLLASVEALAIWKLGLDSGVPALLALAMALLARRLGQSWLALILPFGVAILCLPGASWEQQAACAVAFAVSLGTTIRGKEPIAWVGTLSWAAGLYALLRLQGPLRDLPPQAELPLLVGFGLVLESGVYFLRHRGRDFVQPLTVATALLPFVGIGLSQIHGGLTVTGLGLAGALFCLRFVFRSAREDLVAGVLLLDAAAVFLAIRQGWGDPIAFIGPVGLSVLVVAQLLRRSMDPKVVVMLRYGASFAIYASALGQGIMDPGWTFVLLLLSLVGMGLGAILRVRAFLYLGSGFAVAGLVTELLRFGLTHSQFWAFYLTGLGLVILGSMVLLTVFREQVKAARTRAEGRLTEWE